MRKVLFLLLFLCLCQVTSAKLSLIGHIGSFGDNRYIQDSYSYSWYFIHEPVSLGIEYEFLLDRCDDLESVLQIGSSIILSSNWERVFPSGINSYFKVNLLEDSVILSLNHYIYFKSVYYYDVKYLTSNSNTGSFVLCADFKFPLIQ